MSEVDGVDEVATPQRPERPPLTPAQRRARRQTVTLLVVCGLLLVSFLFAAAYYGGWFDAPKSQATLPPCTTPAPVKVKPSQIRLNVYNATNRNGLARKVAGEMRLRGFTVGDIANDPLHRSVRITAEVRYGTKGKAGAQLVSSEVTGSKLVADKRKDASVNLVLGGTYTALVATTGSGASTSPSCTPSSTATATSGATGSTSTKK